MKLRNSLNTSNHSNDKKKVLLIITRLTIGGDTNVVLDIASYLLNTPDFDVHLAVGPVPEGEIDLTNLAYEREIPVKVIPNLINKIRPLDNLKAIAELRALMIREKYDIVHTHSSVAGIIGRTAAFLARTPIIVHHIHGWGVQENMPRTLKVVYLSLERLCAKITTRLIAVSIPTKRKGVDLRICSEEKISLIYNGIRLEDFRENIDKNLKIQELGLNPDYKIVGMIGRLDKQKNPLDFIKAAAIVLNNYSDVQFFIAGDGLLRGNCDQLIDKLALRGKFYLLGFRNDINQILPILKITVMSSLWEGLPMVFQEAMSAGIPIVANDVDGASDVIVNGETGYLVTPHQPQEMADRILDLLEDDELCNRMGQVARSNSERFSSDRMVQEIGELYKELLMQAY